MPDAISPSVLQEILKAFAFEDQQVPSADVIRELAAASGKSEQAIKNDYETEFTNCGGEGDPWALP